MGILIKACRLTSTDGQTIVSAPVRRGNRDNFRIKIHIFHKKIFCDPSLELSRRDGSNEGLQNMFS